VLSGGYEDNEDYGDVIVYTGHGSNDAQRGRHTADQEFHRGNKALALSMAAGLPVRVIRGAGLDSPSSTYC
jgi:putative restriction endonuclease